MDLVIVGNGFDLAHGLPTSYKDFRLYLKWRDDLSILALEKLFPKKVNKKLILWSDFEEALAYPSKKQLKELHELANTLDENHTWLKDMLRDTFVEWVKDICFYGTSQLDKSHPFHHYLKEENVYLSFNYTETLEQFYNINNVFHIHGCPIHNGEETHDVVIFGHKAIETANNYILSTEKPVNELMIQHKKWFNSLTTRIDGNVVIMGLSCSDVDQMYLQRIHALLPDNNWVFFYHTNTDLENYKRLIEVLDLHKNKFSFIKC